MKNICTLFRIISGFHKGCLSVLFFIKLLSGILSVLPILLLQTVINMLQSGEGDHKKSMLFVIGWLCVNFLRIALESAYIAFSDYFAPDFREYIDRKMINKAAGLTLQDFEEPETSDMISRAQTGNGEFLLLYMQQSLDIVQTAAVIFGRLWILYCFQWKAAGILALSQALWWAVLIFSDGILCTMREERDLAEQKKRQIRALFMTKKAYREIRIQGHDADLLKRYEEYQSRSLSQNKKIDCAAFMLRVVFDLFTFLVSGGICVYIILAGYSGRIGIGDLLAYMMCAEGVRSFGKDIFESIRKIMERSADVYALSGYLELPEEEGVNRTEVEVIQSVEFRNVSFRSGRGEYALKDINLYMKSGEIIVISGERSSGKSAFTRLIAGLYEDYEGEILVNGVDLRQIDAESYRKRIEIVFQDSVCEWDDTAAVWDVGQKADLYIFEEPDAAHEIPEQGEFRNVILKNGSIKEVKSMSVL